MLCGAAACCAAAAVLVTTQLGGSGISGLNGAIGKSTSADLPTAVRHAGDFTGWLANNSGATITLESATLLPSASTRTPRLVGTALEVGNNFYTADVGWPPKDQPHADIPIAPLAGFRLASGRRAQIIYGISGSRPGDYIARGVIVKVRAGSETASVPVIAIGGICVSIKAPRAGHSCTKAFNTQVVKYERP